MKGKLNHIEYSLLKRAVNGVWRTALALGLITSSLGTGFCSRISSDIDTGAPNNQVLLPPAQVTQTAQLPIDANMEAISTLSQEQVSWLNDKYDWAVRYASPSSININDAHRYNKYLNALNDINALFWYDKLTNTFTNLGYNDALNVMRSDSRAALNEIYKRLVKNQNPSPDLEAAFYTLVNSLYLSNVTVDKDLNAVGNTWSQSSDISDILNPLERNLGAIYDRLPNLNALVEKLGENHPVIVRTKLQILDLLRTEEKNGYLERGIDVKTLETQGISEILSSLDRHRCVEQAHHNLLDSFFPSLRETFVNEPYFKRTRLAGHLQDRYNLTEVLNFTINYIVYGIGIDNIGADVLGEAIRTACTQKRSNCLLSFLNTLWGTAKKTSERLNVHKTITDCAGSKGVIEDKKEDLYTNCGDYIFQVNSDGTLEREERIKAIHFVKKFIETYKEGGIDDSISSLPNNEVLDPAVNCALLGDVREMLSNDASDLLPSSFHRMNKMLLEEELNDFHDNSERIKDAWKHPSSKPHDDTLLFVAALVKESAGRKASKQEIIKTITNIITQLDKISLRVARLEQMPDGKPLSPDESLDKFVVSELARYYNSTAIYEILSTHRKVRKYNRLSPDAIRTTLNGIFTDKKLLDAFTDMLQ